MSLILLQITNNQKNYVNKIKFTIHKQSNVQVMKYVNFLKYLQIDLLFLTINAIIVKIIILPMVISVKNAQVIQYQGKIQINV